MTWDVEYTDEFGKWWQRLTEKQRDDITATTEMLMELGPKLGFPHSSGIEGSRHAVCANFAFNLAANPFGSFTPLTRGDPPYYLLVATKPEMIVFTLSSSRLPTNFMMNI